MKKIGESHPPVIPTDGMRFGTLPWYSAFGLQTAAMVLMWFDPWFRRGHGTYPLAVTAVLISFITLSTLYYDSKYFGKPKGGNLVLQLYMFLPFTLFVSRMFRFNPEDVARSRTLAETVFNTAKNLVQTTIGIDWIPKFITEIFAAPMLTLTLLLLFLGTAVPKQRWMKAAFLFTAFLFPMFNSLAGSPPPSLLWWGGAVCMFFGFGILFHDVEQHAGDFHLVRQLRNVDDRMEFTASVRICKKAMEKGKISPETVLWILRDVYGNVPGTNTEALAESLCAKLVSQHHLLVYVSGEEKHFLPSRDFRDRARDFSRIVLFPRDLLVFGFAIAWWISPVDLIPDYIPVVGFIDDMIVFWLGASPFFRHFRHHGRRHAVVEG